MNAAQNARRFEHAATRRHSLDEILSTIREIPDFPRPGILFRDITPLLANPRALRRSVEGLAQPFADAPPDCVAGMEARGFIFGSLVAQCLGIGFVPLRKPGKLPAATLSEQYELEYGTATLELHADAIEPGQRILVVDDLLATGGTAAASCALLKRAGGDICGCAFVIELEELGGRQRIGEYRLHSLVKV